MAIFIGENIVCALEAGSGNARKGSLMYLRPSKAHFYFSERGNDGRKSQRKTTRIRDLLDLH